MAVDPNTISFELTPIEQNAPRRYKRMAMMLPLAVTESSSNQQTVAIMRRVATAFFNTLQIWPIFAGKISTSKSNPDKLSLDYPDVQNWVQYWKTRADLIQSQIAGAHDAWVINQGPRASKGLFNETFFACDDRLTLASGLAPLTLKISIFENRLVLGFAFYEALFDGESISRFFDMFIDMAWTTEGNTTTSYTARSPLTGLELGQVDKSLFLCYDWSSKAAEERTPREGLAYQLVVFKKLTILKLIDSIQATLDDFNYKTSAHIEDCVAGLLWVMIMRARFKNKRVTAKDKALLNVLLPGDPKAREAEEYDETYVGNSTVAAVAEYKMQLLISAPDDSDNDLNDVCDPEEPAVAANAIRKAIDLVDYDYMEHLLTLKEQTRPEDDWAAYERAINTSSTGLTLEDWTCYGAVRRVGIPHTGERASHFLPCADDMEEGKIILLPCQAGHGVAESDAGWPVWLCLAEAEMDDVLKQLDLEGWWEN